MLKSAKSISIAKGKKIQTFDPHSDDKELILKHAIGPSGNLRAPTYIQSDQVIIGYNPDLYEEWIQGK